jgi:hypothetical protein
VFNERRFQCNWSSLLNSAQGLEKCHSILLYKTSTIRVLVQTLNSSLGSLIYIYLHNNGYGCEWTWKSMGSTLKWKINDVAQDDLEDTKGDQNP